MNNYLVDTNIVSEYLKGNQNVLNKWLQASINGDDVCINGIVYYEIKRGFLAGNMIDKLAKFNGLCNQIKIYWANSQDVFDEAIAIWDYLRSKGQLIDDADILIAATAKINNLIMITDNQKHFQRINGIKIDNWL
jgi:tRNA(fMet)-specific endonuclease VapC